MMTLTGITTTIHRTGAGLTGTEQMTKED